MAEQGIEQAALSVGARDALWKKFRAGGRSGDYEWAAFVWEEAQRAMQPHLAREGGEVPAEWLRLASECRFHLYSKQDIERARSLAAELLTQHDLRPAPVASDAPQSSGLTAQQIEAMQKAEAAYFRGTCPVEGVLLAFRRGFERGAHAPVASDAPAGEPQSAGDAETVERMLDALEIHGGDNWRGYCEEDKSNFKMGMTAALAVAREGYVPARVLGPVTDEEWLDMCGGDHVPTEWLNRSEIDLFLKRRLAPEPMKALTAEGFLAQHGYCDSRPHSATAIAWLMEDYAELKAQKESANG